MKLLLDTHALLWFSLKDARLSEHARFLMCDRENDLLISPATIWEIAIKISLGKYRLHGDFATFFDHQIAENELTLLPITVGHTAAVARLPFHHRDPFDRLLIAQALTDQLPLVSADSVFDRYSVPRIW